MSFPASMAAAIQPAEKKPVDAASALEVWKERYRQMRASYDAARSSTEYDNIWANADTYDADSAHSKSVRHTLIKRSRYEVGNNGFSDGIAQTYANDLVGNGPTLRMQTGSEGFNRVVELSWHQWTKQIHFRRKLWTLAHAKHVDGESFGILHRDRRLRHPVKINLMLVEAEQCQTPLLPFNDPRYIDGIHFDEYGNVEWYDFLEYHPGSSNHNQLTLQPRRYYPEQVLHWFKLRRPGQHRGVPECASTLNSGAAARRWREATLAAAETAADFTMFVKTQFQPDSDEMQYAADFSQQEITKRMMTALPVGYEPFQMKAEQPTATYESFHRALLNEQARPKNMPFNKAACDSSSYNYASGRLDHQTYYQGLDGEREDCNDLVLDPLFREWFNASVIYNGWLGGNPEAISEGAREHLWDWPKHRVADVESEANANKTKLASGQVFLHRLYSDAGVDLADDITAAAAAFGVAEDEIRKRLLDITLPVKEQPQAKPAAPADNAVAAIINRMKPNGVGHG